MDLSKYKKAIIVPSSKGWEVLCPRYPDETKPLPTPAGVRISRPPKDHEAIHELQKLQIRVRELERELEQREAIHATSKPSERFAPIYSCLVICVILGLWYLVVHGVLLIAKFLAKLT